MTEACLTLNDPKWLIQFAYQAFTFEFIAPKNAKDWLEEIQRPIVRVNIKLKFFRLQNSTHN